MNTHLLMLGRRILSAAISLTSLGILVAPAQAQYGADIARWTNQDAFNPPAPGAILFTGSSSIRRWEQLTRDFADYHVLQRGIGGAQFDHIVGYIPNIVLPYQPRAIVVWAGTNDLASGNSGAEVFEDYQNFVNTVHAAQPNVDIFYLGIMPTPGRQGNRPQEDIANASIATMAAGNPKLHYIDLPAAFSTLNPYGSSEFSSKFVDSIHLNRDGYDFWTSVVRPQIEAVIAPNKVFALNPNTLQVGKSMLFDFGPSNALDGAHTNSPDANGHYWNNWTTASGGVNINAGEHVGNLVDSTGVSTGINLTITGGFQSNGFRNGGLRNPDPALLGDFAIDSVTGDYFFSTADGLQGGGDDDIGGGFMLDGLDPNLLYDFSFFGSRNDPQTRITEYRVTGANDQSVLLQTSGNNIGIDGIYDGNDDEIAEILGVQPDQFGQVFVDLTLKAGNFAYIAAMKVTVTGTAIPEPSSAAILAIASIALAGGRRRLRRH